jgi:hypothetical protein
MNPAVLREAGLEIGELRPARLSGFDITIGPRANLVRAERAVAYGVLAEATHDELDRLYAHARNVLGELYLPEPVLVQTSGGAWCPALVYLCPDMKPAKPDPAYVERILRPAREHGFPQWYLDRIASFAG